MNNEILEKVKDVFSSFKVYQEDENPDEIIVDFQKFSKKAVAASVANAINIEIPLIARVIDNKLILDFSRTSETEKQILAMMNVIHGEVKKVIAKELLSDDSIGDMVLPEDEENSIDRRDRVSNVLEGVDVQIIKMGYYVKNVDNAGKVMEFINSLAEDCKLVWPVCMAKMGDKGIVEMRHGITVSEKDKRKKSDLFFSYTTFSNKDFMKLFESQKDAICSIVAGTYHEKATSPKIVMKAQKLNGSSEYIH